MRHSTHDKGHEEGGSAYAKAGSSLRSPPGYSRASTPKNQSLPTLLLYALIYASDFTGGCLPPPLLGEGVNLQLQLIQVPGQLEVFKSKPLRWLSNSPDKFTLTPTAMHTIVYSLSASRGMGSLRYSNSLEPLRELETVRIKLVKDIIDEPMLAAKFPHPLYRIGHPARHAAG